MSYLYCRVANSTISFIYWWRWRNSNPQCIFVQNFKFCVSRLLHHIAAFLNHYNNYIIFIKFCQLIIFYKIAIINKENLILYFTLHRNTLELVCVANRTQIISVLSTSAPQIKQIVFFY